MMVQKTLLKFLIAYWCATMIMPKALAQEEMVLSTADGVDLVFVPDNAPLLDGSLIGGTLRLRSPDVGIATIGGISFDSLHNVAVHSFLGVVPSLSAHDHVDPLHTLYDSHLLLTDRIQGIVGELLETGLSDPTALNPNGLQAQIPPDVFGNPAVTYSGAIDQGGGAFFLRREFPNILDVARLVGLPDTVSNVQVHVLGSQLDSMFDVQLAWDDVVIPKPPTDDLAAYVVATSQHIDVLFLPDESALLDGDLMGGTLVLRTRSEAIRVNSLQNMSLETLHHVGVHSNTGVSTTPSISDHIDPIHARHDSHLLFLESAGGANGVPFQETGLDMPSDTANAGDRIPPDALGNPAVLYGGEIHNVGGSISLPRSESATIELARLVGVPGNTTNVRFGVTGNGIVGTQFNFDLPWGERTGTPPSVQFDRPKHRLLDEEAVMLSATAFDTDGEVTMVEYFDGANVIPECRVTAAPFECEWNPRRGQHVVRARARDNSGMSVYSAPADVYVDSPGDVSVTSRRSGSSQWTLRATGFDADGVASLAIFVDGVVLPECSSNDSLVVECGWSPIENGTYTIQARSIDRAGFTSTSDNTLVTIGDVSSPQIRITNPSGDLTGNRSLSLGQTLRLVASVRNIEEVSFYANDKLIPGCTLTTEPFAACEWTPAEGEFTVVAEGTRATGETLSDSRQITVVDRGPLVTLLSPTSNGFLTAGESLHLAATATDNGQVASVEFTANELPIPSCRFTEGPYECEWFPDEGNYTVKAIAVDDRGTVGQSVSRQIRVYSPDAGGVDVLPVDENGNAIVGQDAAVWWDFLGTPIGLFQGLPAPEQIIEVPVIPGDVITLLSIQEIDDENDVFSYVGEMPPIEYGTSSRRIRIRDFELDTSIAGPVSATYELRFDDDTNVLATISATIQAVPESDALLTLVCFCLLPIRRKS